MTQPPLQPFPEPPGRPHCGHGATPADPVGCRGVHVGEHTACLAHLDEPDRVAYIATLTPGADIDHCGTPFTPELLDQLLNALRDPTTGCPHFGDAWFDEASFSGDAQFDEASFSGNARFGGTSFSGNARFDGASFSGNAQFSEASFSDGAWFVGTSFSSGTRFDGASFSDNARFLGASFSGSVRFDRASFSRDAQFDRASFSSGAWFLETSFSSDARFDGVSFSGNARFDRASFSRDAQFDEASFSSGAWFLGTSFFGNARFGRARFERAPHLGPLVCNGWVVLDRAVFEAPVTLEIAARQVSCARTRWASTATLHLRYAELNLRDAVLEYPVLVAARPDLFSRPWPDSPLPETLLSGQDPGVRLTSLGGVDSAHLALHDVDLSGCRFAGAIHLDQLRVDGWCTFATTPTGWNRRFPWRWSRRNTLAEEHHWRSRTARRPALARGWTAPPQDAPKLKPAAVAALYRQLRKSLEDGKNEPDAADFYYGECEMRRHDTGRPWGERVLLTAYWALSGYGLRAARALAWLGAAMAATIAVMVLWGLPAEDPRPTTTGRQVAAGQQVTLTTDTPKPANPTGPWSERVTAERGEKALRVVINSVVFRSSGQDLTTTGTYTEMASRFAEPVLLGLAVLAVRSRVKR
ncbi:pentapeptide repeat-containing protein [Streptomyces sp. TRM 70361]|uniref:pentapeptide repeat-containing protein n=1 Tax=Streptomyces sp. TRM 70361 TaxID=3116553 RepID=UPI002E7B03A2|nr:pentapeptide repeat-containing protein [Streptomyces sp. TRM 70361]MEE1938403.1 pentapeptide repeat-containing protein [Streptomyces sp. TRM 70361]